MQGLTEEDEGSKSSDGGDSERSSSSSIPGADLATYPRYMLMQTWLVFCLNYIYKSLSKMDK